VRIIKLALLVWLLSAVTVFAEEVGHAVASGHAAHWTYEGEAGPAKWGKLSAEFAECSIGHAQSPINLTAAETAQMPPVVPAYVTPPLHIINNGHTIMVSTSDGGETNFAGKQYKLVQFHFHAPSEHKIDGKTYAMEIHLVHRDSNGQLAVLGVMAKRGKENPEIKRLWENIPKEAANKQVKVDIASMLPSDKSYYHYVGSLTTPPCSEGVMWYVLKKPIEASADQLQKLAALFKHNERPVQPLNGRKLLFVKDTPALATPMVAAATHPPEESSPPPAHKETSTSHEQLVSAATEKAAESKNGGISSS